jgi:ABC-type glycerol-3-phosphate transport system substrate-binding protein
VDLTLYLTGKEMADLIGLQEEYMKMHGGIFRVPWWNGMSYMYYRKDLLKKEGVSIPKTWDEFLEVSKKLTRDLDGDGEMDQWGYVTQGTPGEMYNNFVEFLYQAGGDEWKLAPEGILTEEAERALEFMSEIYRFTPPALSTIGYEESRAFLKEGKVAMLRDWAEMGKIAVEEGLTDVVGVMNFPAGPAGPYGIGHCWGPVVNKYGRNKDAAIDFVKFMFRPEIHKIPAAIEAPALKSVLADEEYMGKLAEHNIVIPYFEEFIKFRRVRKFPPGRAVEYHEGIGRIVTRVAITGELTVEKGLVELQKWIDPLIAEFKE